MKSNPESLPIILGISSMSPRRINYWVSLAKRLGNRVQIIDPDRRPIRSLRVQLRSMGITGSIYRASTGGKWGCSATITKI